MPLPIITNLICICRSPFFFLFPYWDSDGHDDVNSNNHNRNVWRRLIWKSSPGHDTTIRELQNMWVDGLMEKRLGWHKANLVNIQLPSCEPRQPCHPSRNHLIITIRLRTSSFFVIFCPRVAVLCWSGHIMANGTVIISKRMFVCAPILGQPAPGNIPSTYGGKYRSRRIQFVTAIVAHSLQWHRTRKRSGTTTTCWIEYQCYVYYNTTDR